MGVAVHPSPGWSGPAVVGHLAAAGFRIATSSGAPERQGIVQRLDVGTSGGDGRSASPSTYSLLKNAFRHREVDKTYHTLVQGHPDPLEGTIDAPIARHPSTTTSSPCWPGAGTASHYQTLEAHRFASLLEVHLETGRTHQIRVHMAALKHPCVGDLHYGADPALAARLGLERQWLHAVRLGFSHPETGEYVEFESPYPADLAHALEVIRAAD
ncbi:MAG: pseudouridine synthase [Nocardioides sp.]